MCFDDWMGIHYDVFIDLYSFVINSPIVLPNVVIIFLRTLLINRTFIFV